MGLGVSGCGLDIPNHCATWDAAPETTDNPAAKGPTRGSVDAADEIFDVVSKSDEIVPRSALRVDSLSTGGAGLLDCAM